MAGKFKKMFLRNSMVRNRSEVVQQQPFDTLKTKQTNLLLLETHSEYKNMG